MKCASLLACAVVWVAACAGAAQETQPAVKPATQPAATENLPEAASLFDKHIAAIGGMEALKAERNRLVRAKYAIPSRSAEGIMRVLRVSPDKFFVTLEIPGITTQETWCNSEGGWSRETNTGTRRLTGEELAELRLQAEFMGEAGFKTRYREITTVGREKIGESEVFVVQAVPREGKARKIYFDATTGLLAAIRMAGETGPESGPMTVYSEYKKFGEVLHPTKSVVKIGSVDVRVITITKIESNLVVMPSVDPPDEVKTVK